jgi:hypothetical protein
MVNYQQAKIYEIVSDMTRDIYVGSTCLSLEDRFKDHKYSLTRWNNGKGSYFTSFKLLEYSDASIRLIEHYPCNSQEELHKRERYWIESLRHTVNKCVPFRDKYTKKTVIDTNSEDSDMCRKRSREYYYKHRDERLEYAHALIRCSECCEKYKRCAKTSHYRSRVHLNADPVKFKRELDKDNEVLQKDIEYLNKLPVIEISVNEPESEPKPEQVQSAHIVNNYYNIILNFNIHLPDPHLKKTEP